MSSKVDIANRALMMLGASPLVSFADETTEAIAVNTIYDQTRLELLRSFPWRCATCIGEPARNAVDPIDPEWDFMFCWPENCLRILTVIETDHPHNAKPDWRVVGKFIYTKVDGIAIYYILDIPEPRLDVHVEMVLAQQLAMELAYTLTASDSVANRMTVQYEKKLQEARTTDRQEATHVDFRIDTLSVVRR